MILVMGESSDSHIAEMAERANRDGRSAVVFYFSDFDPSGHQMPISVARKLQALRDLPVAGTAATAATAVREHHDGTAGIGCHQIALHVRVVNGNVD